MNPSKHLSKTLLASSIAAIIALSSTLALAQEQASAMKTYTDPATGELRVAPKLLSEMSEQEKAALTEEEKTTLEEIEAQLKKEKMEADK